MFCFQLLLSFQNNPRVSEWKRIPCAAPQHGCCALVLPCGAYHRGSWRNSLLVFSHPTKSRNPFQSSPVRSQNCTQLKDCCDIIIRNSCSNDLPNEPLKENQIHWTTTKFIKACFGQHTVFEGLYLFNHSSLPVSVAKPSTSPFVSFECKYSRTIMHASFSDKLTWQWCHWHIRQSTNVQKCE